MRIRILLPCVVIIFSAAVFSCADRSTLSSGAIRIEWQSNDGWSISSIQLKQDGQTEEVQSPSGEYTLLYSATLPETPSVKVRMNTGGIFPEPIYHYQKDMWERATNGVAMNTAGNAYHFYPSALTATDNTIELSHTTEVADIKSTWTTDKASPTDIIVDQLLIAKQDGYFSLASPALMNVAVEEMAWATVPGYFQGNEIQNDTVLAYAYGQGVPSFPALFPERCASTLASIIDTKDSLSIAVIPEPGLGRDPWKNDTITHADCNLGISHMSRKGNLSPTLYYPVLGEKLSKLAAGDTVRYRFRYSVRKGNWFESLNHAANGVYQFDDALVLRKNKQSLTNRIEQMHYYLTDPKTSLWNIEMYQGLKIGGQSYLGGVVGSNNDAMKNADYGAMWMLAKATGDPKLIQNVLPYALNFKLVQQQDEPGFFQGAAVGQYYLRKSKKFVEEWGEFVEPVSLTYYTMLDVGNILLFDSTNAMLKQRLRLGADRLIDWQQEDGSWKVAYDRQTKKPLFEDIRDLRPTFYGLIVAYKMLKDEKYLLAAKKGADWMVTNAVDRGHFLGVCGDARYAPDFATGQTAQALLDFYELTKEKKYLDAAIKTARIYTTSIYTHPVPSTEIKHVEGVEREDWEIAQAGLSFEHGGIFGSAQRHGPIQLASHAGLFIRMFALTKDSLFLTMARSGAVGRDAFVDDKTSVASYYWQAMNRGAGPYPHHAWWQIGWITDYLMAEAEMRSNTQIKFPRGFVTPKVGPHQSYGFEPGKVYGVPAEFVIRQGLILSDNPNVETITAISVDKKKLFLILMNDVPAKQQVSIRYDLTKIDPSYKVGSVRELTSKKLVGTSGTLNAALDGYGLQVFEILITN
ncbi:MAG TPA: glycerophosphoryl diester phosphodiesterase [Chryseosolibacter sp.]